MEANIARCNDKNCNLKTGGDPPVFTLLFSFSSAKVKC